MQMIHAIVRPNKVSEIIEELEMSGIIPLTKIDVFGRGKQGGIPLPDVYFAGRLKAMLMIVVEDEDKNKVLDIMQIAAYTGKCGDGKIFINPVEAAYTISTGEAKL